MKDSQQGVHHVGQVHKYIKADNERFSTFFRGMSDGI